MNPIELMTLEANATVPLDDQKKRSWFKRLFGMKKVSICGCFEEFVLPWEKHLIELASSQN
jgi:hypothetical protein